MPGPFTTKPLCKSAGILPRQTSLRQRKSPSWLQHSISHRKLQVPRCLFILKAKQALMLVHPMRIWSTTFWMAQKTRKPQGSESVWIQKISQLFWKTAVPCPDHAAEVCQKSLESSASLCMCAPEGWCSPKKLGRYAEMQLQNRGSLQN